MHVDQRQSILQQGVNADLFLQLGKEAAILGLGKVFFVADFGQIVFTPPGQLAGEFDAGLQLSEMFSVDAAGMNSILQKRFVQIGQLPDLAHS